MGKKDKKGKSAEQKAQKLAKQSKKAAKGEKKSKAKQAAAEADSDIDDNVDLDAVLAAYAEEQAKYLKVTEQAAEPPSPRSSSTFVASPSNANELFLFGGEYYDGTSAVFYNDLFVYHISRGEWKTITSPNSPLPRSGHAWCRGGNTGGIYLFGGEFSSPKQGTFYHYNDFWHLDTDTREWTRLESKGKGKTPPARSGHRMTYWKNYIILFGGFQDTSQQTKYLKDAWIYDVRENLWHEFKLAAAAQKPDARSSFSLLPHDSGAVIYGGYARVKITTTAQNKGKPGPQRNIMKPMVYQDTWFLRIIAPAPESPPGTPPAMRWERRKRPANAFNPPRAGITMAYHKGRGVAFGGVVDVEESEEGIDSEFFQELFIWNIDRNRMFPLALRRPKTNTKQRTQQMKTRDRGKADEEELLRNLAALEAKGAVAGADTIMIESEGSKNEDDTEVKKEYPIRFETPHRRFNALLTVQDDVLYIYGGTFEKKDIEITFSDLYAVDLLKLDGVKELYFVEPHNWNATAEESDEEDEDEEDEDHDSEGDDDNRSEDDSETAPQVTSRSSVDLSSVAQSQTLSTASTVVGDETELDTKAQADPRPFPRPFETLRDFFARSTEEWQRLVLDKMKYGASQQEDQSIKELRKKAFELAEDRWWDCREEVQALEDEQEAAGIGDVVSLADKERESGAGRRR